MWWDSYIREGREDRTRGKICRWNLLDRSCSSCRNICDDRCLCHTTTLTQVRHLGKITEMESSGSVLLCARTHTRSSVQILGNFCRTSLINWRAKFLKILLAHLVHRCWTTRFTGIYLLEEDQGARSFSVWISVFFHIGCQTEQNMAAEAGIECVHQTQSAWSASILQ